MTWTTVCSILTSRFENRILGPHLAWTPISLSVELFLKDLVRKYGRHPVWTDAGDWYPPACELMNLKHHVYLHGSWLWEVMRELFRDSRTGPNHSTIYFPAGIMGRNANLRSIYFDLTG